MPDLREEGDRLIQLPIETARLRLRRFEAKDLSRFLAYRQDPEVAVYQGWSPDYTESEGRQFIEGMAIAEPIPGSWFQTAIADRKSDDLIGDIGLHTPIDSNVPAEIGFTISREYQRKGLAFEAVAAFLVQGLAETGIEKVVAITDSRNSGSIRLIEKLGFRMIREEETRFKGESVVEFRFELQR